MTNNELAKSTELLENSKDLDWYHRFEVLPGSGLFTPGRLDTKGYSWRREFLGLTEEFLAGKRVLDIGAYSGAFSFLLQDLGAEVVAADVYDPDYNGFNLVKEIRKKDLPHHQISVYDLDPNEIGTFDIVAFYGVHYHLRHPLLAFERCNSVCKDGGLFVGGGTGLDSWFHDKDISCQNGVNFDALTIDTVNNQDICSINKINDLALCGFAPGQFFKDKTNWFIPNLKCLLAWVESSGFEIVKSYKNSSPIPRDWNMDGKIKRTALNFVATKNSTPSLEYTWKRMKQFKIPTRNEVDRLEKENEALKAELRKLKQNRP